jgi:hypothetical protein
MLNCVVAIMVEVPNEPFTLAFSASSSLAAGIG